MDSDITLRSGLFYAMTLYSADRLIEAERLAATLVAVSRQVNGPEHNTTIDLKKFLGRIQMHCVRLYPEDGEFQALLYENDVKFCVVTGPISKPRKAEDEQLYHADSHLVFPVKGCLLICQGLISAPHLNGELGIAPALEFGKWWKMSLRSALVKPENLHIVFDLPSEGK